MKKIDTNELDKIAMQVILHAGDGRTFLNEVIQDLENDQDESIITSKLEKANECIVIAHRLQTKVIQGTIEQQGFCPTLLFIHAQDTLMTINSELNIVRYLIRIFNKKNSYELRGE